MTASRLLPRLDSNQDQPVNSRTLCQLSYGGSVEGTAILGHLLARSETSANGCLRWTGAVAENGYGQVGHDGKTRSVHRFAYELIHGPIPATLQVDHTCHNTDPSCAGGFACLHRRCWLPEHLEAVTGTVNQNRAGHGREEFCKNDHPLSGDNLIVKKRGYLTPVRNCRTCRAAYQRARRRAVSA